MKPEQLDLAQPVQDTVAQAATHIAPRWIAPLFITFSVILLPWIVYLALSLPPRAISQHYRLSWVGFDLLLVLSLGRTGWLALRNRPEVEFPALATAVLLIVDAWFDVTTAAPGPPLVEAILLALVVELPTAALALYIPRHVERILAQCEHEGDAAQ